MEYDEILNYLSPCGLNCSKCFAFYEGEIAWHSRKLKSSLGNFDIYAQRFVELLDEPVFSKYPDFKEMLALLSEGQCMGCRNEKCKLFKNCKVRDCSESKGVDFCFQCSEFPCSNTGFDKNLEERSVKINFTMKDVGVESYYNEIKDKLRY